MKHYVIVASVLVLIIVGGVWVSRTLPVPSGAKGCTEEAKVCPDGSAVGRTGPNCEFAACPVGVSTTPAGGGGSILPYNSGVQGMVSLGPTCPVERIPPDPQCADKPFATAIIVSHTGSSSAFVLGNSDKAGVFKFSLPPGSYTLKATSGKVFPRCPEVTVVVPASGYASTTISCDSGIR